MDVSELTTGDWVRIIAYGALAAYVATAIPGLFRGRVTSGFLALAFWILALFTALAGYSYRFELGTVAERVMAVLIPGTVVESGDREVTVFRQPDGQFMIDAAVGKTRLSMVLDTGASSVVLRAEDAKRLHIAVKQLVYDVEVSTANGRSMAAEVTLPSLAIGSLEETGLRALVAKSGALHESLLGMSFLNRLESFTVSNDKLVMRGR